MHSLGRVSIDKPDDEVANSKEHVVPEGVWARGVHEDEI